MATVGATILFRADRLRGRRRPDRSILLRRPVRDRPDARCPDARDARARSGAAGSARSARSARSRSCWPRWPWASCSTREGAQALFWVYLPFLLGDGGRHRDDPATRGRRRTARSTSCAARATFLAKPGMLLFFGGFTVVWAALAATNAFYSIQIVALGGSPGWSGSPGRSGRSSRSRSCTPSRASAPRFGTERLRRRRRRWRSPCARCWRRSSPIRWSSCCVAPLEGLGFTCVFVGGVTVVAARAPAGPGRHRPGPVLGERRPGHDHRLARRRRGRRARSGSAGCSRSAPGSG